jgi:subtilisin family serine protease
MMRVHRTPRRRARLLLGSLVVTALLTLSIGPSSAADRRQSPDARAVQGQYLIKFTPGSSHQERRDAVERHDGKLIPGVSRLDINAAFFDNVEGGPSSPDSQRVMNDMKKEKIVRFIEPNFLYRASFTPNDPGVGQQWAWGRINAYSAWDVTQGSSATTIAIVDTGIQRTHPDLDAKIVAGYDYVQGDTAPDDGNGHGTHVAGTAAAETNNATGGAGTCPNCKLMPVRVLDNSGSGSLTNVANGITWAADHGAKVVNLSLGGPGSSTLQSAVDYASGRGVFLSCAAGNSNTSSTSNAYPAAYGNCFAVASTTSTDARSSFSNYGSWVEVAAPGSSIYSTWLNSGYNTISGTSMATPHVSGLAGLLSGQGLSNAQIRQRICDTAADIAGTGTYWTCGRIDARAAVSDSPPPPPPPPSGSIQNGGFENGTSPWVQSSSGGYQLITTNRPRTGSYSAWLGGYNNGTDTIGQTVTIPSNGTLTYWWYMTSSEGTSTAYDYFRVRLYNSSGALVATVRTRSNTAARGAWFQDSISLGTYAGQALKVQFEVTTDYSLVTSFFVDDVSL